MYQVILCDLFLGMAIFRDFKLKGWNGDLQLRDKKVTNWITFLCGSLPKSLVLVKKNFELSYVRIESISKEMQGSRTHLGET